MPSQFIDKENNHNEMGLKKVKFPPNFTFITWPNVRQVGRIFGFGRTLILD